MHDSFKIAELIAKKIQGTITGYELTQLEEWLAASEENRNLFNRSANSRHQLDKLNEYNSFEKEKIWNRINAETRTGKKLSLNAQFVKYAAAILLPLMILGGIAYTFISPEKITIASIDENIHPGTQKAVLILSNGDKVELNENDATNEFKEEGVQIDVSDNQLNYSSEKKVNRIRELVYNELKTPRGGGYNLKLTDGTEVWLNAGSSLKFPVEFLDSTRVVEVSGEAYFKVTHTGKPFIVHSHNSDIRVLGTSFNVSAYSDEQFVTTTLIEGKVQVNIKGTQTSFPAEAILVPGMQSVMNKENDELVVQNVQTSQYTSWIDGKLEFTNQNLELVMKKLARWYDFDYTFKNEQARNYHFSARFNNDQSISSVLELLEMTTKVKFEIEENTIVIL